MLLKLVKHCLISILFLEGRRTIVSLVLIVIKRTVLALRSMRIRVQVIPEPLYISCEGKVL